MVNRPIPVHPELTGIAVAAPVPGMIADEVLSDVTVTSEAFKWNEYPDAQGITAQNTEVGRTSQVQRVEFGGVERDGSVKDHGLESPVPRTDSTANSSIDPDALASEMTSQLVTLAREVRVRNLSFAPGNYLPAQVTTLGAGEGWYDPDVNPLEQFDEAREKMRVEANTLTLGPDGWRALRSNPFMVKNARPSNTSGEGRLTIDEVRDVLEIDRIIIGKAFVNYANPGQDAVVQRLWERHASLTYVERVLKNSKVFTWGSTFRLTGKQAWKYFDEKVGLEGGDVVRVGERLAELVVAKQAGWLFLNAAKAA